MSRKRDRRNRISRPLRRKLGLPEKGPTGLSKAEERRVRLQFGREGNEKGKEAERLFLKAWSDPRIYPAWLISVRAATHTEDSQEKTDAVMETSWEQKLRIQIKAQEVMRSHRRFCRLGIVLVQVLPDKDSLEEIQDKTLHSIERYRQYQRNVAGEQQS